jgi:membrane-associated phospholipid phosphatase
VAIARAPLHWNERTWKQVALILAADGAAFAADQEIADVVQRNRTPASEDVARIVTPFGGGRGLQLAGATLLTGLVLRNPRLRDTGRDAVEASFLASGIITPALKRIAGRTRPNGGDDASFPSGHATNAFAIASVFAAHSEGRVVPTIAYTLATAVAIARVHDNVHYTSDVFAGAVIGTAVGRSLVARHRRASTAPPRATWTVVPLHRGLGVQVAIAPETLVRFMRASR